MRHTQLAASKDMTKSDNQHPLNQHIIFNSVRKKRQSYILEFMAPAISWPGRVTSWRLVIAVALPGNQRRLQLSATDGFCSFKHSPESATYLFPICLLATDSEAMAETVSASSASRCRASLSEQPSVEAERCSERQYLPTDSPTGAE